MQRDYILGMRTRDKMRSRRSESQINDIAFKRALEPGSNELRGF
jgi:hypothetical protein